MMRLSPAGRLGLLLAAALCLPALLAVAAAEEAAGMPGVAGPLSSNAHRATAGFADLEYSVPFYGRLWTDHPQDKVNVPEAALTARAQFLGEVGMVERDGSGLDLSFAVKGQSEAPRYQNCLTGHGCKDVTVRVNAEGLLYLYMSRSEPGNRNYYTHLGGFPRRAVELSASDAGSGLKVYREVMVNPSPAAAGCEDYGDDSPEAFTCLFLRELLPPGQAGEVDEEARDALRAGLPPLVQDSDNYRLVFAEEFNGEPPAADANGCRDGLSTLDETVWNYFNACHNVDSRGEPCGNVADGSFTMAVTGTCGSSLYGPHNSMLLNTWNHFHMKYGYVEFQYTFNLDQWQNVYQNLNLVLYTWGDKLRYLRDQYGVEIQDWEDFLKHNEVEIDIFETVGSSEISHQYANWSFYDRDLRPVRAEKWIDYCDRFSQRTYVTNPKACNKATDTFTVTRGVEWTPRGYRTYIKVDGINTDLTLLPKDKITVQQRYMNQDSQWNVELTGQQRDRYFEYVDSDNTGTLLEQVAVGHIPLPFFLSAWSFMEPDRHPYIRQRLKFDYIRVWQPENLYTDMEPVYQ